MKNKNKRLLAALLGVTLASTPAVASASVPETAMEETVQDNNAQLARTQADYAKLFEDYREIDCNLDVNYVEALLEIEEFIETTYNVYFEDELSMAFTVDSVLKLRHAGENEFGFAKMVNDWKALDLNDSVAVKNFLELYGPYLADLHAHNYFTLVTLASNIQNQMAYYVKQDVENSDFIRNQYAFGEKSFNGGKIAPDLSQVELFYNDNESNYDVTVNIVGSQNAGDGLADIQNTYFSILREVSAFENLMVNGIVTDNTATVESFGVRAYTLNDGQQVYEIVHNDRINELIRNSIQVSRKFNPAEAYQEQLLSGEIDGVTVTMAGYGHYFDPAEVKDVYNAETNTHECGLTEVFELPQIVLDRPLTMK